MKLNELRDNHGATTSKKRLGRGIGSGLGKTSGRGVKGQKARSGVSIKGFEGGQMPIFRRLPKRGFVNIFRKDVSVVNFFELQKFIDDKKIDASKPITSDVLKAVGLIRKTAKIVKALAKGDITSKIDLHVNMASKSAEEAIKKAGGQLTIIS